MSETAKQWGHAEAYIAKPCATGRVKRTMSVPTFEAFAHTSPGLRFVWLILANASKSHTYYTRLTEAQRDSAEGPGWGGEDGAGPQYSVTRAYVHRLLNRLA